MHILCTSDKNFAAHTAAMLASVCAHNDRITAHWIASGMTSAQLHTVESFFGDRGLKIHFYPAPIEVARSLPIDKHASQANYFRIFAPNILPSSVDRVIYIDSDVIVRRSLMPLWQFDMGGAAVAAVGDPTASLSAQRLGLRGEDYFNSGIMLLDMNVWRHEALSRKVLEFISASPEKIVYWDQDGLNAVLRGRWSRLPATWNVAHFFFADPEIRVAFRDEVADPAIVHFSGQNLKPWQYSLQHPFKHEYRIYRRQTPWPHYREDGAPTIIQKTEARIRRIAWLQLVKKFVCHGKIM